MNPLISVVTATWKRPKSLFAHTIPAVAGQSYQPVEHLIVIDGQDRGLRAELEGRGYGTGDRRIVELGRNWTVPFQNESNGWACRMTGSYLARGEWITYLDDDNDWAPGHLQGMYDLTQPEGTADFVYTRFRYSHGQPGGMTPPVTGHIDTSAFMHHWSLLKYGSWQPDGYACDGALIERWVDAGARWAFKPDPTVTLNGPNFGRPE